MINTNKRETFIVREIMTDSHEDDSNNNGLLVAKITSMFILGGISLALGLLPFQIKSKLMKETTVLSRRAELALSSLSCFGAGVILTTCLTHMLPEVNYFLRNNIEHGYMSDAGLPLAEILVICGFLMIYWTEELAHAVISYFNASAKKDTDMTMEEGKNESHDVPMDVIVGAGAEASFQAKLRGFLVILALSLHAIFEGIAIGLVQKASYVWYLCFAVSAHKFVISFCLGVQFVMSGHLSFVLIAIYQATFSLISSIGIAIGLILTEISSKGVQDEEDLQTPTITILQALAAGTLLYVVFFEVLEKERTNDKAHGLLQVLSFSLGFVVMVLLQLLESHEETPVNNGCQVDANNFTHFPVNVTCNKGVLKVVEELWEQ